MIDYVHPTAIRLSVLSVIGFVLIGCALWVLQVITLAHVA
ncbi:MAG: hypothetical protein JBO36_07780 [Candidatus Thiodiazotropha taylori]|nr:hypothetical protein [Candidatus Thiodiazotropha taylori]MCG8124791.1 hypothetical protein [Candidatus Thiodiazotropha taylori]